MKTKTKVKATAPPTKGLTRPELPTIPMSVSISRPQWSDNRSSGVTIELVDEKSNARIVFELTPDQFVRSAIGNHHVENVPVSFLSPERLGLKRQIKTIKVYTNKYPDYKDKDA
jgi:hypothetical protein